jgi:hypothetical protein
MLWLMLLLRLMMLRRRMRLQMMRLHCVLRCMVILGRRHGWLSQCKGWLGRRSIPLLILRILLLRLWLLLRIRWLVGRWGQVLLRLRLRKKHLLLLLLRKRRLRCVRRV